MSSRLEKDIQDLKDRGYEIDRENVSGKLTINGKPHEIENDPWSQGSRIAGLPRRNGEVSDD